MSKILNDKYYTNTSLAKYCIDKTFSIIGEENIGDVIEPSAGDGSFSNQLNCTAYDIEPENSNIIKQDFLKLNLKYKSQRLIIGNPPFGERGNLIRKFYNKSVELGDYIAFILPIKFYNNNESLYKFDLIYSEDLGKDYYSNVNLHCCFNIYKRPKNGLNKKNKIKLNDVTIISSDKRNKVNYDDIKEYNIRIGGWGSKAGMVLDDTQRICDEYKIIINNNKLKDEIIFALKKGIRIPNISTPRINKHHIIKFLVDNVKDIK